MFLFLENMSSREILEKVLFNFRKPIMLPPAESGTFIASKAKDVKILDDGINCCAQDIVKKITKPAGFLYNIYNGHHVSDEAMQQFAEEIGITKIAKGKFSH